MAGNPFESSRLENANLLWGGRPGKLQTPLCADRADPAGQITDADTRITRECVDVCHRLASFVKGGQMWGGGAGLSMGAGDEGMGSGGGLIRPGTPPPPGRLGALQRP